MSRQRYTGKKRQPRDTMAAEINISTSTASGLAAHEADLSNPHQVKTVQLVDVDFTTPLEIGTGLVWTGDDPTKPFEALNVWVAAGYGEVNLATPTALPDIGIGWTTLLFDTNSLAAPRNVTQDAANNGLRFDIEGVFLANINFTLVHNEDNAGREIEVRIYNATKAVGGVGTSIGIARNQPATNFSAAIMAEIPASEVGDLINIQIGNGDTLLAVQLVSCAFSAHSVSEYRG